MAKQKPEPIISHTEILTRAYHDLHREIREWHDRANNVPAKIEELSIVLDPLHRKMDAVKSMYLYETGVEM